MTPLTNDTTIEYCSHATQQAYGKIGAARFNLFLLEDVWHFLVDDQERTHLSGSKSHISANMDLTDFLIYLVDIYKRDEPLPYWVRREVP
jgi:hypothetical protein